MESIKEIISWYATRKAELIVETEPQEAINIISEHLAESLGGGNYSTIDIFARMNRDGLLREYNLKVKQDNYDDVTAEDFDDDGGEMIETSIIKDW